MSASPSEAHRDLARVVTTDKFAAVGYRHDPYNAQMPWYLTVPTHVSVFDKINFAYATGAGVIGCRLQDLPDMMLIRKVPSQYAKARAPWKQPGYVRPPDAELCDLFIGALPYGHCPYVVGKLFADAVGAHVHYAEEIPDKHPQVNGSNNKSTSCRLTVRVTDRDACLALSLTSIITGGGLLMVSPAAHSRSVAVKHFGDQLRRRDELIEASRPNASRRKGLRPMVVQNTASTARRAGAGVSDYAHSGGPNS